MAGKQFDVFISHATEDKEAVAEPLANELLRLGISVWYDDHQLRIGDSLTRAIDFGLAHSDFGALLLSPHFFAKDWPQRELAGLQTLNTRLLPIWHEVTKEEVASYSPLLADRFALKTSEYLISAIAQKIADVVRQDGTQQRKEEIPILLRDVVLYGAEYDEIGDAIDQWQGDKSIGQSVLQAKHCAQQLLEEIESIHPYLRDRRENIIYSFLEPACQTVLALAATNREPSTIESDSPWANLRTAIQQTNTACADLMNHYGPQRGTLAQELGLALDSNDSDVFRWLADRMYYSLLTIDAKLRVHHS